MNVTDVKIRRVVAEGRMKALASITLDHEFVVHDLRVIEGNSGLFVAMPSKRTQEGIFRDVAHPINALMRKKVEDSVLEAYVLREENEEALDLELTSVELTDRP
ncbi:MULTISPECIES: septation regulator SpoVG [unclassified Exiguobacterium]|uniref:septation regulator SpoVG n=1 Tax=unclassified Exiguobacterium TaxID=2644629 RepID=UPI000B589454|nr:MULTISPECIES: septation regulator SpoVG [unclassified Exiguobacterium]ASI34076.1 septation protein spoVG [Exiguobacterium sp. N4-1P]ASI37068.1 septation protein spoVG [Exiguobacterium sp. N4-1P]